MTENEREALRLLWSAVRTLNRGDGLSLNDAIALDQAMLKVFPGAFSKPTVDRN